MATTRIHSWLDQLDDELDFTSHARDQPCGGAMLRPDSPLLGTEYAVLTPICTTPACTEHLFNTALPPLDSLLNSPIEEENVEEGEGTDYDEILEGIPPQFMGFEDENLLLTPSSTTDTPSLLTDKSKSNSWSSYSPSSILPHTPNSSISINQNSPMRFEYSHSRDSSIASAIHLPTGTISAAVSKKSSVTNMAYSTRVISRQSSLNFSMPTFMTMSPSLSRSPSFTDDGSSPPSPVPPSASPTLRRSKRVGSLLSFSSQMSLRDGSKAVSGHSSSEQLPNPENIPLPGTPGGRKRSRTASSIFRNAVYIESEGDVQGLQRRLGELEVALNAQALSEDAAQPDFSRETANDGTPPAAGADAVTNEPPSHWSPSSSVADLHSTSVAKVIAPVAHGFPSVSKPHIPWSSTTPAPAHSALPTAPAPPAAPGESPKKQGKRKRLASFLAKMATPNPSLEHMYGSGSIPPTPTIPAAPTSTPVPSTPMSPSAPFVSHVNSRHASKLGEPFVESYPDMLDPFAAFPIAAPGPSPPVQYDDISDRPPTPPSKPSSPFVGPLSASRDSSEDLFVSLRGGFNTPRKSRFSLLHPLNSFKSMSRLTLASPTPSPLASSHAASSSVDSARSSSSISFASSSGSAYQYQKHDMRAPQPHSAKVKSASARSKSVGRKMTTHTVPIQGF